MNLKLRYSIIIIDLSLENPKIQELPPLAEIVWYLLHSRKYLQPKKIVKPLGLAKS
jgi:hypothetical protein